MHFLFAGVRRPVCLTLVRTAARRARAGSRPRRGLWGKGGPRQRPQRRGSWRNDDLFPAGGNYSDILKLVFLPGGWRRVFWFFRVLYVCFGSFLRLSLCETSLVTALCQSFCSLFFSVPVLVFHNSGSHGWKCCVSVSFIKMWCRDRRGNFSRCSLWGKMRRAQPMMKATSPGL